MKKTIILFLFAIAGFASFAQTGFDAVLKAIETNNTSLKALRQSAAAQKLENKSEIYLSGPELGFAYLWGNPAIGSNRTDVNITQSFDIATLTGFKNRLAGKENLALDWQYEADRKEILLQAKRYCIDMVYLNTSINELNKRLEYAGEMEKAFQRRLQAGDANLLEYNNILLNRIAVQGELERVKTDRFDRIAQLKLLNGGTEISLNDTVYNEVALPDTFDLWYAHIAQKKPELTLALQQSEISKDVVKLNRLRNLPAISAGYMSEKVGSEHFQGLVMGVSIPLWENKNRLARAKAGALAAQAWQTDISLQDYLQTQIQYDKALRLKTIADTYSNALKNFSNLALLKKALMLGEISVVDYFAEQSAYYNLINQLFEAKRDYQKAVAELFAAEL